MTREALAQEWRERLEDFAVSEMTVQEWCDFNRLSPYQYYYWRRRLATPNPLPADPPRLVAVEVVDMPAVPTPPSTLIVGIAGAHIEVATGVDPALLRAVVAALQTKPC